MEQLRACQGAQTESEHNVTKTSQACRKKNLLGVRRVLKDKSPLTRVTCTGSNPIAGKKEYQEIGTLRTGMRNIKNKKAKVLETNHTLV